MNREETEMMEYVTNSAILQRTKEEILSEIAYTVKFVEKKASKDYAERVNKRLGDITRKIVNFYDGLSTEISLNKKEE